ncbi:polysaccharide biosynthesis tyrosine autokinase [Burkholderia alba]|uniref:polysaccharide biosynthesis tyrosine autokinase n=1 Tax=Burkholderia alba TaxID=2683677 RepID=UPI002B05B993|nr:polysaccharide biosynthesis tyrosine autokinase [Burkholderia alba]
MNSEVSDKRPIRLRDNQDAFSASDLIRLVIDHIGFVGVCVAVATVLCVVYALVATPMYSADATVKVDFPNPNPLVATAPGAPGPVPSTLPTDAEIQIMQSRLVLAPVLAQYGLDQLVEPRRFPLLGALTEKFATRGDPLWVPGLSSFAWGGETLAIAGLSVPAALVDRPLALKVLDDGRYRLSDEHGRVLLEGEAGRPASGGGVSLTVEQLAARPGNSFTVTRYSEERAMKRFMRNLKISESGKDTGVVGVRYENADPVLAQAVTNSVVNSYLAAHVAQRQEEASKTRAFIESELPTLRDNLTQAEANLSQYRASSNSMTATTEASSYLQASLDLDRQITALQVQRAAMASRFTDKAPEMQVLDRQIGLLQKQKGDFDSHFKQLPNAARRASDLTRSVKVAEDIYVAMVNKANELMVTQSGTLGNVHLIDTAVLPASPFKPNRLLIIGAGAVGGFVAAVLFLFFRAQLQPAFDNPRVVERQLNAPVLGNVLYSERQAQLDRMQLVRLIEPERASDWEVVGPRQAGQHFLLAADGTGDLSIEELHRVRASLQFRMAQTSNNILAVMGATAETGKTFVAANLAALSAQAGQRVLLIDGDLRRGRLAALFGQPLRPGLAEVLTGELDVRDAIRSVGIERLSVMAAGRYPANPSALLSTPVLRERLAELAKRYDIIVVDTPPVLAASDAHLIGAIAGSSVLVVRPNAQSAHEIAEAAQQLERTGACVVGVILNAIPRRRSERYA